MQSFPDAWRRRRDPVSLGLRDNAVRRRREDTPNRIYCDYFADNQPVRTTVEVGALPAPDRPPIAIELKVIATIADPD